MVRRQGLEPRPRHRLRACRSTIELAARDSDFTRESSGSEDSNLVCRVPGAARLPLRYIPLSWTTGDSNPAPPVCRTGALPDELAAHCRRGRRHGGTSGRHGGPAVNGAHAIVFSMCKHFTLGWCSAGTAGVEPAFRSGWSRAAQPLADPRVNENRPGISLGRLPSHGLMA